MSRRRGPDLGGLGPGGGRFFGPGELRLALLALIGEKPGHGYDLMSRLEQRCAGAYRPSAGAVYPTLQQLEDEGLVRMEVDSGRKVFHLAEAGAPELRANRRELEEIWRRAEQRGEWGLLRDPYAAEIAGPALRLMKTAVSTIVRAHGDPEVVDRVRAVLAAAVEELTRLESDTRHRHPRHRGRGRF